MSSWIRRISSLQPQSVNIPQSGSSLAASGRYGLLAALLFVLAAAGCGGGSKSTTAVAGLQAPAAPVAFNTYVGVSPFDVTASGGSPTDSYNGNGLWSASFDHSTSLFTALDVTTGQNNTDYGFGKIAGSFTPAAGFLSLDQTNDPSPPRYTPVPPAGFAFEIPGRVAVLRQGDNSIPVTAMVPTGCPSIDGNTKFNFVVLPTYSSAIDTFLSWDPVNDVSYGSILIANSGASWNFASFRQLTLAGAAGPNDGAALPAGTCAPTGVGTSVWVPSDPTKPLPKTVAVGPSGFYIAELGQDVNGSGYPGEFGVIQPSAALNTENVLSHQYVGFIFEPGAYSLGFAFPETQLASFGPSTPADLAAFPPSDSPCTSAPGCLLGGGFPSLGTPSGFDDPTQPVVAYLTLNLGTQDPKNNGVYPNVQITNASSIITDPNTGNIIPYQGVAVVGNPESNYAIFILGYDTDNHLPFGLYLFQK